MATLLDTDVLIHLRDGNKWVEEQLETVTAPFFVSAISRVELENGVVQVPDEKRRNSLDYILNYVATVNFGFAEIEAYRGIVQTCGYSRRKTADRMTAATALAHDLTLVTLNGRDYRDVPGLKLIAWNRPPV